MVSSSNKVIDNIPMTEELKVTIFPLSYFIEHGIVYKKMAGTKVFTSARKNPEIKRSRGFFMFSLAFEHTFDLYNARNQTDFGRFAAY